MQTDVCRTRMYINPIYYSVLIFSFIAHLGEPGRVATDLENLEKSGNLNKTSQSQGICDRIPKVREKSGNFVV